MRLKRLPHTHRLALALLLPLLLGACDIPGLGPDPRIAQREEEAKAIGGACRYALRGIEDCYAVNEKASKAAVFAGWKDMDGYMRDNKIEGIAPNSAAASTQPTVAASDSTQTSSASK